MAVEIQAAPTLPEMAEAKDQHEMDSLKEFGKCAVGLRNVLYQDRALSEGEFHFMDNHFQALEMAYLRWKRKHGTAQGIRSDAVLPMTQMPLSGKTSRTNPS
jgi:hypothetical protein